MPTGPYWLGHLPNHDLYESATTQNQPLPPARERRVALMVVMFNHSESNAQRRIEEFRIEMYDCIAKLHSGFLEWTGLTKDECEHFASTCNFFYFFRTIHAKLAQLSISAQSPFRDICFI
jgi:hypothetical protein